MIEDEEKMAKMLSRVLREEGHVVETAGDGRTGLSRALDDSFDLLSWTGCSPRGAAYRSCGGLGRRTSTHPS
jgi:DNA-binding response OmpR family regulator